MREIDFVERRSAAAGAKKLLIEKMRQAPKYDDPVQVEKRAQKAELKAATALQRSERIRLKLEAEAQKNAEDEARAIEAANAERAQIEAAAARAAEQKEKNKAKRDRRYAARKSR